MAVISVIDELSCVFVDHKKFIDASYNGLRSISLSGVKKCFGINPTERLSAVTEKTFELETDANEWQLDSRLFEIRTPFMMNSQFERLTRKESQIPSKTRIRKRKRRFNPADSTDESATKVRLSSSYSLLLAHGRASGVFPLTFPALDAGSLNNDNAQKASALIRSLSDRIASRDTVEVHPDHRTGLTLFNVDSSRILPADLSNTLVTYTGCRTRKVSSGQDHYVLPACCSFVMADIKVLHQLADLGYTYDFVVIDPPWANKSVKRKKAYFTLGDDDILNMPVGRLGADGALVVVWVTNNETVHSLVKERLFPAWNVEFCAEWHWLKVTKRGETVFDLNWHHKKPYEHLLIGQRRGGDSDRLQIPNGRVICSVPSSVHSHKPPLEEIFKDYLKKERRQLELFARGLLPGWTSVGNELVIRYMFHPIVQVLLFQHLELFQNNHTTSIDI